jgi:heat shock protein HslJ
VQARKLQERSNRLPKVAQNAPDWRDAASTARKTNRWEPGGGGRSYNSYELHPDPRLGFHAGIAAFVLALLVAAACGSEPDLARTGDAAPAPLAGTAWQLVETSVGGSTTAVPAEEDAVVRFDREGGWSAHGCNYIGSGVEIDGMRLSVDDEESSTDMGCTGPVEDIDTAVTTVLRGDVTRRSTARS